MATPEKSVDVDLKRSHFSYYFLEPIQEEIIDDGSRVAFECQTDHESIKMALVMYPDWQPLALRFQVENVSSEPLPEDVLNIIHAHKEHFLATWQVTHEPSLRYMPRTISMFTDDGRPSLNIKTKILHGKPNTQHALEIFRAGEPYKHLLQLFAHGSDYTLPLTTRYLSLYKILEFRFVRKGNWLKDEFKKFAEPLKENWSKIGLAKAPHNTIHDIRDRCAHALMNSGQQGIVTLSRRDAISVESILPDVQRLAVICIEQLSNGKLSFVLETSEPRLLTEDDKRLMKESIPKL